MNNKKKEEISLRKKLDFYRNASDVLFVIRKAEKSGLKQLAFQARWVMERM
jgi:hypothetical protein